MFNLFKKNQQFEAICLSLKSRDDRWQLAQKEFSKIGYKVERFYAIKHNNKFKSFNLSQKAILESIKKDTIVFEDDVLIHHSKNFNEIISDAPSDWEMLYLGGNIRSESLERRSKYWYKCLNTWTTHAIIYKASVVPKILKRFNVDGYNYDEQLRADILNNVNAYICKPFLATQRPDYSDLWSNHADYTELFLESENKLQS